MKLITLFLQGDYLTLLLMVGLLTLIRRVVKRSLQIVKKAILLGILFLTVGYLSTLFIS